MMVMVQCVCVLLSFLFFYVIWLCVSVISLFKVVLYAYFRLPAKHLTYTMNFDCHSSMDESFSSMDEILVIHGWIFIHGWFFNQKIQNFFIQQTVVFIHGWKFGMDEKKFFGWNYNFYLWMKFHPWMIIYSMDEFNWRHKYSLDYYFNKYYTCSIILEQKFHALSFHIWKLTNEKKSKNMGMCDESAGAV